MTKHHGARKRVSRRVKAHMHNCVGDGQRPCPTNARVGPCSDTILHNDRCRACQEVVAERILFGTPRSAFL